MLHNVKTGFGAADLSLITYLPFMRYWLPWLAKVMFPTYNPWGKQALSSAKNLSPDIPVIIMHSSNDFQTPVNDARRFYCELVKNRTTADNKQHNVYFIEDIFDENIKEHVNLLLYCDNHTKKMNTIQAFHAIYRKHDIHYITQDALSSVEDNLYEKSIKKMLSEKTLNRVDLKPYQPNIEEVQERIAKSADAKADTLRTTIDLGTALMVGGFTLYRLQQKFDLVSMLYNLKKAYN